MEMEFAMNMTNGALQAIAEKVVGEYLTSFPLETYEGRVTTGEVVEHVRMALNPLGITLSNETLHDAIRLLGPCGEHDNDWLRKWGGNKVKWVEDDTVQAGQRLAPRPVVGGMVGGLPPNTIPMMTVSNRPTRGKTHLGG